MNIAILSENSNDFKKPISLINPLKPNADIFRPILSHLLDIRGTHTGKLVFCGFGDDLGADTKVEVPKCIRHVILTPDKNDQAISAECEAAIAEIASVRGRNTYFFPGLMRVTLPEGTKGGPEDVVAHAFIPADLDQGGLSLEAVMSACPQGCHGREGYDFVSAESKFVIETSPGRFQVLYALADMALPDDAKPVINALVHALGADKSGKDPAHVFRVPGTTNWPTFKKRIVDGRKHEAVAQLLYAPTGITFTCASLDQLRKSIAFRYPVAKAEQPALSGSSNFDWDASDSNSRPLTPDEIQRGLSTGKDRSAAASGFIHDLRRRGYSPRQALELMWAHRQSHVMGHYTHEDRLKADIERVWQKPDARAKADAEFKAHAAAIIASQSAHDAGPFLQRIRDIYAKPDPAYLIEGILVEREQVCLYGPPKSGKSFTALDIALSIASGLPLWGKFAVKRSGPIVYLSGEGDAGFKRRIKAWAMAHSLSDADMEALPFYYRSGVPLTAKGADEARRYVEGIKAAIGEAPTLIVLDTMARSMPGLDEDNSGAAGLYMAMVQTIGAGLDTTVLSLGHTGKDERKGIRGSTNFAASFDTVIVQSRKDGISRIETDVAKDATPFGPLELKFTAVPLDCMAEPGFVLELINADPENLKKQEVKAETDRASLIRAMRQGGVVRGKKELPITDMAEWWTEVKLGKRPPDSEEKAHASWMTERNRLDKKLRNASNGRSKKSELDGLFRETCMRGATSNIIVWGLPDIET